MKLPTCIYIRGKIGQLVLVVDTLNSGVQTFFIKAAFCSYQNVLFEAKMLTCTKNT